MSHRRSLEVTVQGQFDRPNQRAHVTLDGELGLFRVKPFHSKREYALPVSTVAEIVVAKVIKAEVYKRA